MLADPARVASSSWRRRVVLPPASASLNTAAAQTMGCLEEASWRCALGFSSGCGSPSPLPRLPKVAHVPAENARRAAARRQGAGGATRGDPAAKADIADCSAGGQGIGRLCVPARPGRVMFTQASAPSGHLGLCSPPLPGAHATPHRLHADARVCTCADQLTSGPASQTLFTCASPLKCTLHGRVHTSSWPTAAQSLSLYNYTVYAAHAGAHTLAVGPLGPLSPASGAQSRASFWHRCTLWRSVGRATRTLCRREGEAGWPAWTCVQRI